MQPQDECPQWYVLRDLKRPNAKTPAYKMLPEQGIEVFTPMHWVIKEKRGGGKTRLHLPYIPDLLFARALKSELDPIIERTDTLQYRYVRGAAQHTPMTVPPAEMSVFITAVKQADNPVYYTPGEITPDMIGKRVMIMAGNLRGTTGHLLKLRGARRKRLLLRLEGLLAATFEIDSDYIRLL